MFEFSKRFLYNGENFIPKLKLGIYKVIFLWYTKNVEGLLKALFFVLLLNSGEWAQILIYLEV